MKVMTNASKNPFTKGKVVKIRLYLRVFRNVFKDDHATSLYLVCISNKNIFNATYMSPSGIVLESMTILPGSSVTITANGPLTSSRSFNKSNIR